MSIKTVKYAEVAQHGGHDGMAHGETHEAAAAKKRRTKMLGLCERWDDVIQNRLSDLNVMWQQRHDNAQEGRAAVVKAYDDMQEALEEIGVMMETVQTLAALIEVPARCPQCDFDIAQWSLNEMRH